MWQLIAPVLRARCLIASRPACSWPSSPTTATTLRCFTSCSHLMQIDVSSPPEYAKTTVSLDGSAFAELATTADEDDVCEVHACEAHA
ncbi:Uncharacterised protein [Chlamydia trachomatis]|nr:Uncharacterised protein [Chlamydia trachomatis]